MSEIRQMYRNAYYGKTFKESETPDEKQLSSAEAQNDVKQAFRRAQSGIRNNL